MPFPHSRDHWWFVYSQCSHPCSARHRVVSQEAARPGDGWRSIHYSSVPKILSTATWCTTLTVTSHSIRSRGLPFVHVPRPGRPFWLIPLPPSEPNCLLPQLPNVRTETTPPPLLNSVANLGNQLPNASTLLLLSASTSARSAALSRASRETIFAPTRRNCLASTSNKRRRTRLSPGVFRASKVGLSRSRNLSSMLFRTSTMLPVFEPDEAARRLCQHWGGMFSARIADIPNDWAETMLASVQPAPVDLSWTLGLDEFEELLASKRESVPGPPLCWRHWGKISLRGLPGLPAGNGSPCRFWRQPNCLHFIVYRSQRSRAYHPLAWSTATCHDTQLRLLSDYAISVGLRRYSIECIHPSPRCITQRIMTDNIFEIEAAAVALRTRYSEDPANLHAAFSCTYTSVDHRWIFLELERAGVPLVLRFFSVIFTMTPLLLLSMQAPLVGSSQWWEVYVKAAQRAAFCSPWPSTPTTGGSCQLFCRLNTTGRDAFTIIDGVIHMSLNHKKRLWIHYGNLAIPRLSEWVGAHVPVFRQTQIKDHARYLSRRSWAWCSWSQMVQGEEQVWWCVRAYPHFLAASYPGTRLFF